MEKTEIPGNGEMWDVEPRAAADVAARFEVLDAERRVHYAAMAAAGVLPEEAPFSREREWRKIKDESLKIKGDVGEERDREVVSPLNRAAGVLTVLAIPGIGAVFGLMAAFAMIAEEGLPETADRRPREELRDDGLEINTDLSPIN